MKENPARTQVAATRSPGLHNDFSEQEETMTRSAMPPKFALTANGAANNRGSVKVADASPKNKPVLQIGGVPADLLKKLYDFEGLKWEVYKDSLGKPTGGLGHLLKSDELANFPVGSQLSTGQVMAWAQQDVGAAWNAAQDQAEQLGVSDHDFVVALGSMCFQNGLYWNSVHKRTWALMKEHKWEAAAVEAADSDWAKQTPTRLHDFQSALRKMANPTAKRANANPAAVKSSDLPKSNAVGSNGPHGDVQSIKQVQIKLQAIGLYNGSIDGKDKRSDGKESNTTKGIKKFQESHHLSATGEVDAETWAELSKVESLSIWQQFMHNLEKQQAEGTKPKQEKGSAAEQTLNADKGKALTGGKGAETNANYSVEKAVAALNKNANAASTGYCARYVRMAINAGGIATPNQPNSAKDYKGYLEQFGFSQIAADSYQKGDIAIMESFTGAKKDHPHGHIQMWNGTQWVSDFKQLDFWPGGDYRTSKPGHVIYRM